MNPKTSDVVYAFIDSQNLNLGVNSQGWRLDWRKFRQYLRNKYNVIDAFLFIGYKVGNEGLYVSLRSKGYRIVFKPAIVLPNGTIKGNVDAELVLHAMIEYPKYTKAIIVSGDGDFCCLAEYLEQNNKLMHLIVPNATYSHALKAFSGCIVRIDQLRASLEYV